MTIRDQIMSKRRRGELIDNLCKKLLNTQKKLKNAQIKTDTQSPTSYDEQENVASTTNPSVLGDELRQIGKKMDFLLCYDAS